MKHHPLRSFLLPLFVSISLVSCKKDTSVSPTGLIGTWKLTNRECYCLPMSRPDESVTFTGKNFSFCKDGRIISEGTYTKTTGPVECGSTTQVPILRLAGTSGVIHQVVATIDGRTLVLDYRAEGGGCISDTSIDTYERLP
ncbi:hypothetical protein IC235_00290 [Hymenobacter sp. BT664]|uniref:Lipocalin-like domain-containing protein n=1 Tax=Hymenobacter montanus TaxID=2771359 RepID=A0A927B8Z8_9BACT|nr:hypothetical protein [Hymenobacter montanus]MBD2766327.1 hypothetical protein [Hymenobacter montanus]